MKINGKTYETVGVMSEMEGKQKLKTRLPEDTVTAQLKSPPVSRLLQAS